MCEWLEFLRDSFNSEFCKTWLKVIGGKNSLNKISVIKDNLFKFIEDEIKVFQIKLVETEQLFNNL